MQASFGDIFPFIFLSQSIADDNSFMSGVFQSSNQIRSDKLVPPSDDNHVLSLSILRPIDTVRIFIHRKPD